MAGARAGTKAQKNRSAVRGGGAKPWRQKGTGRARAGTIRSPLWRKGGVTFAAQPRDFSKKLNKKMYRAGLRSIVSELLRQDRLIVVEEMKVAEPKTRLMAQKMAELGADNALVLTDGLDSDLYLAARNIPQLMVMDYIIAPKGVQAGDVLRSGDDAGIKNEFSRSFARRTFPKRRR